MGDYYYDYGAYSAFSFASTGVAIRCNSPPLRLIALCQKQSEMYSKRHPTAAFRMNELLGIIQLSIPTNVLLGLTAASVIGFVGSLVIIPLILIRLPADYFDTRFPRHWMRDHHPILRVIGLIVKNIVGFVFILAGFIMLFLPGQGLLTILIGISLIDFPGKLELEAKIIGLPKIFNTINNLRDKFGKPPLTVAIRDHDKKNTIDHGN